jgi:hypothetical protein
LYVIYVNASLKTVKINFCTSSANTIKWELVRQVYFLVLFSVQGKVAELRQAKENGIVCLSN